MCTFSSNICRLATSSCSLTCPPAVIPYLFPPPHPTPPTHMVSYMQSVSHDQSVSQSVSQSVRTSLNLSPIPFLISFDHQCIVQEDRQSIFPPRDYTLPGPVANCPFSTFSSNICRLAMSSCSLTWPPAVIPYIFPPSLPTPLTWCSWGDSFNESTEIKNYFTISLTLYVSEVAQKTSILTSPTIRGQL